MPSLLDQNESRRPDLPPNLSSAPVAPALLGWGARVVVALFGVLIPLATLVIEAATGMSREYFDPIPTPWHAAAIALVPVANLLALGFLAQRQVRPMPAWLAHLNAAALGVAAFYSLWYGALIPVAVIGVLFFGMGLLPLSPLFSLIVAGALRYRLHRRARETAGRVPSALAAFALGFGLLAAGEVSGLLQSYGLQLLRNADPAVQARGLFWLRHGTSEASLLRDCYAGQSESARFFVREIFGSSSLEERRQAYFRVTGRPFNAEPAPGWAQWLQPVTRGARSDSRVWDSDLGGDAVGQRLSMVTLAESRLDARIDGDAAVGYLEWTMVFRNSDELQQREARALLQLPPGGVVSRLTLWVDGEEREAAFGGRSQVRQAYNAVVRQRRDPVLVSMKGPDRVLMQCFPIPPRGGEMKVRVGMTFPLLLDRADQARVIPPRIIEQNFSSPATLRHALWVESAQGLTEMGVPGSPVTAWHGTLSDATWETTGKEFAVRRNPLQTEAWASLRGDPSQVVVQQIARRPAAAGPLAVVIDGSRDLAQAAASLATLLEAPDFTTPLRVWVASDELKECPPLPPRAAAEWLRAQRFRGGQDATTALRAAVETLGEKGGTVLWLHGAQPTGWQNTASLDQALERRAGRVRLVAFAASPGTNAVLERFVSLPGLAVAPRGGLVAEDLARVLTGLRDGEFAAIRSLRPREESRLGTEGSSQLGRLWGADEVRRLLAAGQFNREAAVQLATRLQLVTAMTSAVVLETQEQYAAAGLTPVEAGSVLSVPDGGSTLGLLALGVAGLCLFARQLRMQREAVS